MSHKRKFTKQVCKPTGEIGFTRMTVGKPNVEFIRIPFSSTKDEIETLIVRQFISFWENETGNKILFTQNSESDLDFTLHLPGGDVLLELTEIVFPYPSGGSPYRHTEALMTAGEFADQALRTIGNKTYPRDGMPKHLLCYITHWTFLPWDAAIMLIQHALRQNDHPSENIFLLEPFDANEGAVRCLFPVPENVLVNFEPEKARVCSRIILDPNKWVALSDK